MQLKEGEELFCSGFSGVYIKVSESDNISEVGYFKCERISTQETDPKEYAEEKRIKE